MSNLKSQSRRSPSVMQPALQAALSGAGADPLRRAVWLDALEQQFVPLLPPVLAAHCRLANVAGDRLVFVVDSPIWRAKLRLIAPELVEQARSLGLAVNDVTAKIALLPAPMAQTAERPPRPMSAATRAALEAALAALESPSVEGSNTKSNAGSRRVPATRKR